jgi:predicted flap endonuclease-1-like 5' DNA nuclease
MLRNIKALLDPRLSSLARSKEIAKDNGVPLLVWVLVILALALLVGFIVWWYRRHRAMEATPEPEWSRAEEIELPVPTAEEMAASAPAVRPAVQQFEVSPTAVPEPPPPLDLEAVPPAVPEPPPMPEAPPVPGPAVAAAVAPAAGQDDLERIEGIGPRIASILRAEGITTFGQLAETEVIRLRDILVSANLRFTDPSTWPEQARLAAAGDWAAFEALTRELRGGRRIPQP